MDPSPLTSHSRRAVPLTLLALSLVALVLTGCDSRYDITTAEAVNRRMQAHPEGRPYYLAIMRELRNAPAPRVAVLPDEPFLNTDWARLKTTEEAFLASGNSRNFARAHILNGYDARTPTVTALNGAVHSLTPVNPSQVTLDGLHGNVFVGDASVWIVDGAVIHLDGLLPY